MRILISISSLPYATSTLHFAGIIARAFQAQVRLMTVVQEEDRQSEAQQMLEEAVALLGLEESAADTGVRLGSTTKQILREMRRDEYDLVIMGARHGLSGELFLSSIVSKVMRQSRTPVLVVKQDRAALRHILACTSGHEIALTVVEWAVRLAQPVNAAITLLHVAAPLPSMYTGLAGMEEELSELLETDTGVARHLRQAATLLERHEINARLLLRHGVPAQEILQESEQGDYDLIVVGSWHRPRLIRGLFTGDVARMIVDDASRPVLTIYHERARGSQDRAAT